jgi:FkbM family methyltransferase
MGIVRRIASDFWGLCRVCGSWVALKWLMRIGLHLPTCLRTRNLSAADRAMGEGPFRVRYRGRRAVLAGSSVMGSIRELWVRQVYLAGDFLTLPTDGTILNLGGNGGYFTALALTAAPAARVIAVEPSRRNCDDIRSLAARNGWQARTEVCNAFVGGAAPAQADPAIVSDSADGVAYITEDELIARHHMERIAFLKCDIEGSEFGLFKPGSTLSAMTGQLALEIHDHAGDRSALMKLLQNEGFELHMHSSDPQSCIVQARRPDRSNQAIRSSAR